MQFNSTNIDSDKIRMPFNLAMTVGRDLQSSEIFQNISSLVNLYPCISLCEAYNESDTTFGLLHTSSDLSVFFDAIAGTFHIYAGILVNSIFI